MSTKLQMGKTKRGAKQGPGTDSIYRPQYITIKLTGCTW